MTLYEQMLLIAGMAIVTYIPRVAPLLLLSSRTLPEPLMRWLEMVPPSVLAALLASELFLKKEGGIVSLSFGFDNIFMLAAIPTFITGRLTRNFFVTIAVGILSLALLRHINW